MKKSKKKAKKCCLLPVLLVLACVGGCGYLFKDKIQEKLMSGENEDKYLKVIDTVRLLGDLLSWPINYVKALLP